MFEGRVPGVDDEWEDCQKQLNGHRGNNYKGYKSREEPEARYMNHLAQERRKRMKTSFIVILLLVVMFLLYVIIV